jgi:hypothetical protein
MAGRDRRARRNFRSEKNCRTTVQSGFVQKKKFSSSQFAASRDQTISFVIQRSPKRSLSQSNFETKTRFGTRISSA